MRMCAYVCVCEGFNEGVGGSWCGNGCRVGVSAGGVDKLCTFPQ